MTNATDRGSLRWRFALGSAIGTSHLASGAPCQDSCACEVIEAEGGEEVLVVVVSDGAGSAKLSQTGSAAACRAVLDGVRSHLIKTQAVAALTRDDAVAIVARAREELVSLATQAGEPVREFACTLVVAVVGAEIAVFFQLGDGVVVVAPRSDPNSFSWVFWPERGEYANTTAFLSDDRYVDHVQYDLVEGTVDEVAAITDGIQSLVLDYKARAAHSGFFNPMMVPLRARAEHGELRDLSAAVVKYLDSPRINERTDDDKTLVLASRRTATT